MEFRVDQIDHVELTVPDRHVAASWYCQTLGLRIVPEFEFWADDSGGPLMIGTKNGGTKLALFVGEPAGSQRNTGFNLVAFRVGADQFMNFAMRLNDLKLKNQNDQIVSVDMVVDHGLAFSVYFCDPYGNQLEITTYDHDEIRKSLASLENPSGN